MTTSISRTTYFRVIICTLSLANLTDHLVSKSARQKQLSATDGFAIKF